MTILDRDALRKNNPAALKHLAAINHKLCSAVARRYGVTASADDIAQDVLLSFLTANQKPREDEDQIHVEGYLRKAAQHAAVSALRASKRLQGVDSEQELDAIVRRASLDAEHSERIEDDVNERARAARTAARSAANTQAVTLPHLNGSGKSAKKAVGKNSASAKPVSQKTHPVAGRRAPPKKHPAQESRPKRGSGEHIRQIRARWGITQKKMAAVLHVSLHTLRNYEYGVVANIPQRVKDDTIAFERRMRTSRYPKVDTDQVARCTRRWIRMLGLPKGDSAGLARWLQLRRSTTWRWYHGKARMKRERLDKVEATVAELVERSKRHVEASNAPGK